jgi:hypothetical protein
MDEQQIIRRGKWSVGTQRPCRTVRVQDTLFWPFPDERTISEARGDENKIRMPEKTQTPAEPASSTIKPRGKIFTHDK